MPSIQFVSDTGPLISLEKTAHDSLLWLHHLGCEFFIPPVVEKEFEAGGRSFHPDLKALVRTKAPSEDSLNAIHDLHGGEWHAAALAFERDLPLLIEERKGRRVARSLNIHVMGAAGLVLLGFRRKALTKAETLRKLESLHAAERIGVNLLSFFRKELD